MKKKILLGTLMIIFTGVSYAFYLYNKPHNSVQNEVPAYVLNAHALVNDYDKSEKDANAKYLGKVVEVNGVIAEKTRDKMGNCSVTLQGPDLAGIGCEFDPRLMADAQSLKEGQEVSIKGVCTGVLMDVVLVDCCVVPNSK